jgi:hypothetical protein
VRLFLWALFGLVTYDVVAALCRFETMHRIVKHWEIARSNGGTHTIEQVCNAVNYACIWYPKQVLCLQRSFVTTYLLRLHGVEAEMVLGAQKIPFQAHAWVEVNGRAVNERSDVQATYSVWDRC